jgi:hypothetical protein
VQPVADDAAPAVPLVEGRQHVAAEPSVGGS